MALNFAVNNSLSAITALPASISGGALTLLQTQTASSSATIDFTSNIDSTYDAYMFKFYNIHPATDNVTFQFQADTGTNTNYNQTLTSTVFRALHTEDDSSATLDYQTGIDQAQGTGFQTLAGNIGNDNDQNECGTLTLYQPSSSTFVKHFLAEMNDSVYSDGLAHIFIAGYFNTTTAITRVQFKMSSGNIDSGVIKLYGVS